MANPTNLKKFESQHMRNSTLVYFVKMKYVQLKTTIYGLKVIVKIGLKSKKFHPYSMLIG